MIPRFFETMRGHKILMAMLGFAILALMVMFFAAKAYGQADGGPLAEMTVTALPHGRVPMPMITRADIEVTEGSARNHDPVVSWVPAQGYHAGLELLVVIDDGSSWDLASHFSELRTFMQAQPATTLIGVGYMHNGKVDIEQKFTADHALAGKTLRMPMGVAGISGSPYFALQDLMKHWPIQNDNPRHEILWITDGSDPYAWSQVPNPHVDEAIADLQRADVVVYSIYEPGAGRPRNFAWRINMGQSFLMQVSEETGGEAYFLGPAPAVSFTPYLSDLSQRLRNQYLLEFLPMPQAKPGLQPVRVFTEIMKVDLFAADAVYVPAAVD